MKLGWEGFEAISKRLAQGSRHKKQQNLGYNEVFSVHKSMALGGNLDAPRKKEE